MKKFKIYLDNCCFNRPYDDQSLGTIRLETQAKLFIQEAVQAKQLHLVWSFMLDFENAANPYEARRDIIALWKSIASEFIDIQEKVRERAKIIERDSGVRSKDALHLACSIAAKCNYFITTDRELIKKSKIKDVAVISPIDFVFLMEEESED